MIITRYLVRETLKSQVAIFFILILVFFSQKTINILGLIAQGNISYNLIFPLLGLGIPEMLQLILPLSLFLGLLVSYSKLYINSEIIAMYACSLGKEILVITALIIAIFTVIIAAINVFWVYPWSAKYQEKILANLKANPSFGVMVEKQFKTIKYKNIVLYINNLKNEHFTDIFMVQLHPVDKKYYSIIIAETGYIRNDPKGDHTIILNEGTSYEVTTSLCNFRIIDFKNYQVVIGHKKTKILYDRVEQKNIFQLWNSMDTKSKAEFHWRLTLIVAPLIMALIAVPLSEVNPRYGRVLSMLPAMLLYLFFFMLQSVLHSKAEKGEMNCNIMMWLISIFFLLLAFILNICNNISVHRLCNKLYKLIT